MSRIKLIFLLSIASVFVVAGIAAGGLYLLNDKRSDAVVKTEAASSEAVSLSDPATQEAQTTPDLSKNLGACGVTSKASVVEALGALVSAVGEPVNRGYVAELDGGDSQGCTFALNDSDAINTRLNVVVAISTSNGQLAVAKEAFAAAEMLETSGDTAYFTYSEAPESELTVAQHDYTITVFKGMKIYTLTLSQPAEGDPFTTESARTALAQIVDTAKL
jgi:uncharacterized protein (UPF0333 family)